MYSLTRSPATFDQLWRYGPLDNLPERTWILKLVTLSQLGWRRFLKGIKQGRIRRAGGLTYM